MKWVAYHKSKWIGTVSILLLSLLLLHCGLLQQKDTFRFIFMPDIHVQPELRAVEGFQKAIARVNDLGPAFVITGGDFVMDALGVGFERADSLYTLFIENMALFRMPVYHCIGNHECFGVYPESGVTEDHPEYGKKMFMNRIGEGKTFRSFDHGRWHFILLDPIGITSKNKYIGAIDKKQIEWLEEDLKAVGRERPVALALHIPLYSVAKQFKNGPNSANSVSTVVTNANEIMEVCRPYNLRLVLQGHLHIIEEIVWKGTHFITCGAVSGAWWEGPKEGFEEGFVVVDVMNGTIAWRYEDYGWQAAN